MFLRKQETSFFTQNLCDTMESTPNLCDSNHTNILCDFEKKTSQIFRNHKFTMEATQNFVWFEAVQDLSSFHQTIHKHQNF
jgi:hypothetical protein